MLAVVLATDQLERLYAGLSLLVATAAEGERALGLASFAALAPLTDPALAERALEAGRTPSLTVAGRKAFASSLVQMRALAQDLSPLELYACAAAAETTGLGAPPPLRGVMSTPRFLREAAEARLVVV